ncbi:bifunctional oligoribonuclease/PAP phosphatase NrnA [candidate division KSB1 bacterium]|nr:bifunctional oligoribonuclease/PAP phosphatase NrnA [candidate division KSB1 bacterium]
MFSNKWDPIREFLTGKERILVTTHINPDGDGIGSQIALANYLKQTGKTVILKNPNPVPVYLQFLDPNNEITCYDNEHDKTLMQSIDGAVIVDISDWDRMGVLGPVLRSNNTPLCCIDHHIPTDLIGEVQIIDRSASSTGELIYDFLMDSRADFNNTIVNALYTCIVTDTGSFRYSNTTKKTHLIAADLHNRGVDFKNIFSNIYEKYSKNRYYLMGHLLVNMKFECQDQLVWYVVTKALIQKTHVEQWEIEGLSELTRNISTVEISIMFTEVENGIKVSFRSKGNIPVNELAHQFGGGGHKFACGALLDMDLEKAKRVVIQKAKKIFGQNT